MEHAVLQALLTEHSAGILAHFDHAQVEMKAHFDQAIAELATKFVTKDDFERAISQLATKEDVLALERRIESLEGRVEALERRFDTAVADMRHELGLVAEDLRSQIGILAEAVMATNEKLDRLFNNLDERVTRLEAARGIIH